MLKISLCFLVFISFLFQSFTKGLYENPQSLSIENVRSLQCNLSSLSNFPGSKNISLDLINSKIQKTICNSLKNNISNHVFVNVMQPEVNIKDKEIIGTINSKESKYLENRQLAFIGTPESRAEDVCNQLSELSISALQCGINRYAIEESSRRIIPEKQLSVKMIVNKFHYSLNQKSSIYTGTGEMTAIWQLLDPDQKMKVVKEKSLTVTCDYTGQMIRYLFAELLKKSTNEFVVNEKIVDFIMARDLEIAEAMKGEQIIIHKLPTPKFAKTKELISHSIKAVVTIKTDKGFGSGVIVSTDGYIVTNEHVVDNNKEVKVKLNNGITLKGNVVKKNISADLALVKVDTINLTPLNMLTDEVEIGEDVFAIGTPADYDLDQTVSKGIISGRRVIEGYKFLQTDVSINPGNSGGPLINDIGEILGINSMKFVGRGFEGLGFAIPSSDVIKMLNLVIQ